jgi:hypothetical protein
VTKLSNVTTITIPVSDLAIGLYYVEIYSGKTKEIKRVTIVK